MKKGRTENNFHCLYQLPFKNEQRFFLAVDGTDKRKGNDFNYTVLC